MKQYTTESQTAKLKKLKVPPAPPKAREYNEFRKQAALEFSKVILSDQHRTIDGEESIKAAVYLANKLVEELENSQPSL